MESSEVYVKPHELEAIPEDILWAGPSCCDAASDLVLSLRRERAVSFCGFGDP